MPSEFIDLGRKYDGPCGPSEKSDEKLSYPTLYMVLDRKLPLPDGEFEMTLRGRVVERAESEREEDEPKYRYEIEVKQMMAPGRAKIEEPELDIRKSMRKRAEEMEDEG